MKAPLIPSPLKRGDSIGVVAPAGQIQDKHRFEKGVQILKDMGFAVRFPRQMWPGTGYLSDNDANRSEELHKSIADPEIHGVIAARGGYGCIRILDRLDQQLFRHNPKIFLGFSDITLLLNKLAIESGLVCFHGPVLTSLCDCSNLALERLYHCLTGSWNKALSPSKLEILQGEGEGTGTLVGGNLSTLLTTFGTRYDCNWDGAILLLEDVGEPIYRIDRMLTQLHMSGKLEQISGLILGDFSLGVYQDSLEKIRYTEYIWRRILDLTQSLHIPVWGNFPSGHCADNLAVPLGARVTMNSNKGILQFH